MKKFCDLTDNNRSRNVCLAKFLPDVCKISENTSPSTSFDSSSFDFGITALVYAICLILIIGGIMLWITKYKLQYLFRISCFIFMCHTLALLFNIIGKLSNFQIFSTLLPTLQDSEVFYFSSQKSLWALSAAFCIMMGVIRYHWALPVNVVMDSSNVGFSHLEQTAKSSRRTVRDLSSKTLSHCEADDVNPVYVNGWIPLIDSRSLVKGKAETVIAVGYKFCVYRGENDQVFVVDAYCPHLGADLSAGGKVFGNCVECPFHGWQFDGTTGKCTKIPYAEKIPDTANVKVWKSCEKNGYIFVWHHAENEPPTWELPSVPEIENRKWLYRGRSEVTIHCHIQEIPENGADIAHLPQVHSSFVCFGPETAGARFINHCWETHWSPDEKESHIARIKLVQTLMVCGFKVPYSSFYFDIQQIGPSSVYLYMNGIFGKGVLLQYIITEEPLVQRVVHEFYAAPNFKPFPALCVIWTEAKMVQRDIAVWNNKKYLKNPLFVKEDKFILRFRRWYSQFFSEHSPTLKDIKKRTLDW